VEVPADDPVVVRAPVHGHGLETVELILFILAFRPDEKFLARHGAAESDVHPGLYSGFGMARPFSRRRPTPRPSGPITFSVTRQVLIFRV
jgi:hypothetical protein